MLYFKPTPGRNSHLAGITNIMGNNSITITSLEQPLNLAIQRSLLQTMDMYDQTAAADAGRIRQSFENNLRGEINNWAGSVAASNPGPFYHGAGSTGINGSFPGPGPNKGFGITFGVKISFDAKIRFNAGVGVGYGFQGPNVSGAAAMNFNIYNHGLGTRAQERNLVYDITASAYLVGGLGQGRDMPNYLLNYNTLSPFSDQHKFSLTYGQMLTWNSELNQRKFSFDDIQRQGLFGFRLGNAVKVSTNNDGSIFPYLGGGTDMGWTGGINIFTPLVEFGYQNFTGRGTAFDGSPAPVSGRQYSGTMYQQDGWNRSLNKASTFLRFNTGGNSQYTLDLYGDGWFQNWIHNRFSNPKFEYPNFWQK